MSIGLFLQRELNMKGKNPIFRGAATALVTPFTETGVDYENFGRLMEAADAAGNLADTNFVIVGDHGQISVKQLFNPNILFVQEGLIDLDEDGNVTDWKAWAPSLPYRAW